LIKFLSNKAQKAVAHAARAPQLLLHPEQDYFLPSERLGVAARRAATLILGF